MCSRSSKEQREDPGARIQGEKVEPTNKDVTACVLAVGDKQTDTEERHLLTWILLESLLESNRKGSRSGRIV